MINLHNRTLPTQLGSNPQPLDHQVISEYDEWICRLLTIFSTAFFPSMNPFGMALGVKISYLWRNSWKRILLGKPCLQILIPSSTPLHLSCSSTSGESSFPAYKTIALNNTFLKKKKKLFIFFKYFILIRSDPYTKVLLICTYMFHGEIRKDLKGYSSYREQ